MYPRLKMLIWSNNLYRYTFAAVSEQTETKKLQLIETHDSFCGFFLFISKQLVPRLWFCFCIHPRVNGLKAAVALFILKFAVFVLICHVCVICSQKYCLPPGNETDSAYFTFECWNNSLYNVPTCMCTCMFMYLVQNTSIEFYCLFCPGL